MKRVKLNFKKLDTFEKEYVGYNEFDEQEKNKEVNAEILSAYYRNISNRY